MKTNKGFTLIELMVTLAVAAIILTVAVPSFRSIVQNNRLITQANELITGINLARSEAIKRGQSISICAANAALTGCSNTATAWNVGWIIFIDSDGGADFDAGETILRVWEAIDESSLTSNTSLIMYRSTGLTSLAATATFTLKITGCPVTTARQITVLTTGRPNVSSIACS